MKKFVDDFVTYSVKAGYINDIQISKMRKKWHKRTFCRGKFSMKRTLKNALS